MDKEGILYILKNNINGKCYVGQTTATLEDRIYDHKKKKSVIGMAILKYGIDNFIKYQYKNIPIEYLDYAEIEMIKRINSVVPNGYNIMLGGQENRLFSEKTRKRMSDSHKGKTNSLESRLKTSEKLKGRKRPQHIIDMLIERNTGIVRSEETKKKISESLQGHIPWNKGKKMSEEYNKINSESHKGKKHSDETKRKMSEAHRKRLGKE